MKAPPPQNQQCQKTGTVTSWPLESFVEMWVFAVTPAIVLVEAAVIVMGVVIRIRDALADFNSGYQLQLSFRNVLGAQ